MTQNNCVLWVKRSRSVPCIQWQSFEARISESGGTPCQCSLNGDQKKKTINYTKFVCSTQKPAYTHTPWNGFCHYITQQRHQYLSSIHCALVCVCVYVFFFVFCWSVVCVCVSQRDTTLCVHIFGISVCVCVRRRSYIHKKDVSLWRWPFRKREKSTIFLNGAHINYMDTENRGQATHRPAFLWWATVRNSVWKSTLRVYDSTFCVFRAKGEIIDFIGWSTHKVLRFWFQFVSTGFLSKYKRFLCVSVVVVCVKECYPGVDNTGCLAYFYGCGILFG